MPLRRWGGGEPAGRRAAVAECHLEAIRELVREDYLARADWSYVGPNLARRTRRALAAGRAVVALWDATEECWTAWTSEGVRVEDAQLSDYASKTVLEVVRQSGGAVLERGEAPLSIDSESVRAANVGAILAAPLRIWDVTAEQPRPHVGGVLYADQQRARGPFTQDDEDLALVIAHLVEPFLNCLHRLGVVEAERDRARAALARSRRRRTRASALGTIETRDSRFDAEVLEPLRRAARARKVGLLLLGPTGCGKGYLAQAFHAAGRRAGQPFVTVDVGTARSGDVLDAELVGYADHAGFGAPPEGRPGALALAHGGTLFLDEIGDMPLPTQGKLLRVIQDGRYRPIGATMEREVDLQVVAATNKDLARLVAEGQFREDLYWRLAQVIVRIPGLNARPRDIELLATSFVRRIAVQQGRPEVRALHRDAVRVLVAHDWSRSGNVRGLERTIERAVILAAERQELLGAEDIHIEEVAVGDGRGGETRLASAPVPRRRRRRATELPRIEAIEEALRREGTAAAAGRALELTADQVVWQLRCHGLRIREVLAGRSAGETSRRLR